MNDAREAYSEAQKNVFEFYDLFEKAKLRIFSELSLDKSYNIFGEYDTYSKKKSEWFPTIAGIKPRKPIPLDAGNKLIEILDRVLYSKSSKIMAQKDRKKVLEKEIEPLRAAWKRYLKSWPLLRSYNSPHARSTSTDTRESIRFVEQELDRLGQHRDVLQDKNGVSIVFDDIIFNRRRSGDNASAIRAAEKFYRVAKYKPEILGLKGNLIPVIQLNVLIRLNWAAWQNREKAMTNWVVREMTAIDRDHRDAVGITAEKSILNQHGKDSSFSHAPYSVLKIDYAKIQTPFFGYYDNFGLTGSADYNAGMQADMQKMPRDTKLSVLNGRTILQTLQEAYNLDKDVDPEGAAYDLKGIAYYYAAIGEYDNALREIETGEKIIAKSGVAMAFASIILEKAKGYVYKKRAYKEKSIGLAVLAGKHYQIAAGMAHAFKMFSLEQEILTEINEPAFLGKRA